MLDTIRHASVFSPAELADRHVDVIGIGATGSRIALSLAKLGIKDIAIWDPDKVESHNVPNQVFGNEDVGKSKVRALRDIIKAQTGITVATHKKLVDGSERLGPIVFLLTDTMASRMDIFKGALRLKPHVRLVVETRMGADEGRIYTFEPAMPVQARGWQEAWYPDEETDPSACTTQVTVGPTAELVSGYAVWQFMRWHRMKMAMAEGREPDDAPEHELIFTLRPMMVMGRMFTDEF